MLFPPTLGTYLLLTSATATGVLLLPTVARSVDDQQARTNSNNPGGNVVITMAEGIDKVLAQISATTFADVGTKRTALYHALRAHADTSQAPVISVLKSVRDSITVRSHWLTNQLVVLNSNSAEMRVLQGRSDVSRIEIAPSLRVQLEDPGACDFINTTAASTQLDYNLEIMRLSAVWDKGVNGTGVVVGSIDSGVHHTHEALRHSYKNDNYSWYDAVASRARPYDDLGIGTMSMALLAGAEGVGVAFGAKWISCKAFKANGEGDYEHLISCGEWMLCPTNPDGQNPDCTQAPTVVNIGWVIPPGLADPSYLESLAQVYYDAGIILVVAAGDFGGMVGCSSLGFPAGHRRTLGVGATDSMDELWAKSSRGPSESGGDLAKPDVTAPGVAVRSAWFHSDTSYCVGSGTNRAAPQVAGLVALLVGLAPWVRLDQVRYVFEITASTNVTSSGEMCGQANDSVFPNFHFGYGRVDALAMYECAIDTSCLPPPREAPHWVTAAIVGGTLISMGAMVYIYRTRQRPDSDYEPPTLESVMQQFYSGVWPQLAALQDAGNGSLCMGGEREIGNYIALAQPYDLALYEIDPGTMQLDLNRILGSGEFGVVYSGSLQYGGGGEASGEPVPVAIKKFRDGADVADVASFLKELQIMIFVGEHVNIIQLMGACTQTRATDEMCIVLRACANGSLDKYLRVRRRVFINQEAMEDGERSRILSYNYTYVSYSRSGSPGIGNPPTPIGTEHLIRWTKEIAAGMEFLALRRVIHGDLACRNVLLDENLVVKISDFGLASRLYEYTRYVRADEGQPLPWRWMAPESLQEMKFSPSSDVWAFGITAWEVFTLAQVPYPGQVWGRQLLEQLATGYRNLKPTYAMEEMFSIMNQCWNHNPGNRPSMARVREMLNAIQEQQIPGCSTEL